MGTGLKLALAETPKTGFLATRPISLLVLTENIKPRVDCKMGSKYRPKFSKFLMNIPLIKYDFKFWKSSNYEASPLNNDMRNYVI